MNFFKFIARLILAKEIAQLKQERNLFQLWNKHHQAGIKLANIAKFTKEEMEQVKKERRALREVAKTCPLLNADKDGMYNERAERLFLFSTVRRMEIAKEAIKTGTSK